MNTYYKMLVILFSMLFNANVMFPQWVQTAIGGSDVQCMIVKDTCIFVGTHAGGVFLSTDDGASWTAIDSGLTFKNVQNLAVGGSYLFAGTYNGGVFLSTNNGGIWTPVNNGLLNLKIYGLAFNPPNVYAGTDGSGLFLSTNNGTSWTSVGFSNKTVGDIVAMDSIVFAGVSYSSGGVYRSVDSCKSWTTVMNGVTDKNVLALAVNGSNLYLGTAINGLFLSTNNGDNWSNLNNGLTGSLWSIAFNNSNIFVGTGSDGAYLSTNNGVDWTQVNYGLTNLAILALVVHNNYIFAGCGNSGWVWRRPLSEMTDIKSDETKLSDNFFLKQNYPNPFNPSTVIGYSIFSESNIKLTIFNSLGEQIEQLVNKVERPGYYKINFNASNHPSGAYFYSIQINSTDGKQNYRETKKMILLK